MNISPVVGSFVASFITAAAIMTSCRPSVAPVPAAPVIVPDAAPIAAPPSDAGPLVPPALASDIYGPALPSMSPSEAVVVAAQDLGVAVDALVASEKARH